MINYFTSKDLTLKVDKLENTNKYLIESPRVYVITDIKNIHLKAVQWEGDNLAIDQYKLIADNVAFKLSKFEYLELRPWFIDIDGKRIK